MPGPTPREDRPGAGVVLMALAVLVFTGIDTSAKWLMLAGLPALQVVFARYAGAFLTSAVLFLPRGGFAAFRAARPGLLTLRALSLLGSTMFNFAALSWLPLTLTVAIMFATPIVTTVLSMQILGETAGPRRLAAVFAGFLGVLVVVQPWGATFHWAVFLSIGALFCASLYFVLTRMMAGVDNNSTGQLWANGLATAILLPFSLQHWVWPQDAAGMTALAGIGVLGGVGHMLATLAHRLAEASRLAPVIYVQVIYATLAGYFVFGMWPTVWTALGSAIIIGSGIYIWHRERQPARQGRGHCRAAPPRRG